MSAESWSLLPHPTEFLFGGIGSLPLLAAVGIGVLLWHRTRTPRVPVSTSASLEAAGHDPARPPARPVGQWNAQVTPQGSLPLHHGKGTVRIENGWLGFHPTGSVDPAWIVPTTHLRAGTNSMFAQSEVWIESAQTGRLNLTVSHEHINVFMRNDLKDLRERRYADEFLWVLGQSGAVVAPG